MDIGACDMEDGKPFLSICIPTYNAIDKLQKHVRSILGSPLQNIEVVVSDNCSTDGTLGMLREIDDKRLAVYSNGQNMGNVFNWYNTLRYARGTYTLFCFDKDCINVEYLTKFVNILQKNTDIDLGFCNLYISDNDKEEFIVVHAGIDAIIQLAYSPKHQSGYFYKTEKYKKLKTLDEMIVDATKFPYAIELINAELACCGNGLIVNIPLISALYIDHNEERKKMKSITYSDKNVPQLPDNRITEHCGYISHISTLPITKEEKRYLTHRVFRRGLYYVSYNYYNGLMNNEGFLTYYNIKRKNVSRCDGIYYAYRYSKSFYRLNIDMSKMEKLICIAKYNLIVCVYHPINGLIRHYKGKIIKWIS
jgi:glycosyltransferase involved in cell wall biosynthesis